MLRTERELVRPIRTSRTCPMYGQFGEWRVLDRKPVAVENVPQLVEEIVVNPVAFGLLAGDYRYLATEDYLRENVCLSVPISKGGSGILSPDNWGRAVPLGYGGIRYGGIVGGTVMGKGCFRSGKYYNRNIDFRSTKDKPIGFFGAKDARKEMEIGNGLLEVGYRSSLVLGYAILKPTETRRFLENRWNANLPVRSDIATCFKLLAEAKDEPVFMARVAGVTSRLHMSRPADLYRRAEIVRAAGLFYEESTENRDHFSLYLSGDDGYEETRRVLDKMRRRIRLTKDEFVTLVKLYLGIFDRNKLALEKANTHPVLSKYSDLGIILSAPKDNDPMCITLDFEEATETSDPGIVLDFAAGYARYALWLETWLCDEVGPNFVVGYKDGRVEFERMIGSMFRA